MKEEEKELGRKESPILKECHVAEALENLDGEASIQEIVDFIWENHKEHFADSQKLHGDFTTRQLIKERVRNILSYRPIFVRITKKSKQKVVGRWRIKK